MYWVHDERKKFGQSSSKYCELIVGELLTKTGCNVYLCASPKTDAAQSSV